MTTPRGVARDLYDDVVRQRDAAVAQLYTLQAKYTELSERAMGLKAQEMGAAHASTFAAADPFVGLGPKTQLAVEMIAQGDPELRNNQLRMAAMLISAGQSEGLEGDELDAEVAKKIAGGDQ